LEWWVNCTSSPLGTPVCPSDPSITIHSDESNQGWGAEWNGQSHTGVTCAWSPEETAHHINYLELLAAFLSIKALGRLGKIYQSYSKWTMLQSPVSTSNNVLDLVHGEGYHSPRRAFAWPTEHTGRQGVQNS